LLSKLDVDITGHNSVTKYLKGEISVKKFFRRLIDSIKAVYQNWTTKDTKTSFEAEALKELCNRNGLILETLIYEMKKSIDSEIEQSKALLEESKDTTNKAWGKYHEAERIASEKLTISLNTARETENKARMVGKKAECGIASYYFLIQKITE
jgi:hypothetical protein